MSMRIDEKREEIAEACQRYGIERLFIFGSALREDFRPEVDLIMSGAVKNKVIAGEIDRTKKLLYGA
jgi:predicted nucleotidyltransferase